LDDWNNSSLTGKSPPSSSDQLYCSGRRHFQFPMFRFQLLMDAFQFHQQLLYVLHSSGDSCRTKELALLFTDLAAIPKPVNQCDGVASP
jgi:hypothetical protein